MELIQSQLDRSERESINEMDGEIGWLGRCDFGVEKVVVVAAVCVGGYPCEMLLDVGL